MKVPNLPCCPWACSPSWLGIFSLNPSQRVVIPVRWPHSKRSGSSSWRSRPFVFLKGTMSVSCLGTWFKQLMRIKNCFPIWSLIYFILAKRFVIVNTPHWDFGCGREERGLTVSWARCCLPLPCRSQEGPEQALLDQKRWLRWLWGAKEQVERRKPLEPVLCLQQSPRLLVE